MKVLKVKIGLTPEGKWQYPDFDSLDVVSKSAYKSAKSGERKKWCNYIDKTGSGWLLDRTCTHSQVSVDSPYGTRLGMLLVPDLFADQAVAAFPSECSIMNDTDAGNFYENKVTAIDPIDSIDKRWADKKSKYI